MAFISVLSLVSSIADDIKYTQCEAIQSTVGYVANKFHSIGWEVVSVFGEEKKLSSDPYDESEYTYVQLLLRRVSN